MKNFFKKFRIEIEHIILGTLLTFVLFLEDKEIMKYTLYIILGLLIIHSLEDLNLKKKLNKYANIDQLTKIYNRYSIINKYENIYKEYKGPFYILFIDLDGFKKINDTLGHKKGDKILVKIAQILKEVFKKEETIIGRFGGDEFIIISKCKKIEEKLKKLQEKITKLKEKENLPQEFGASIGVIKKYQYENIDKIIEEADKNMYKIKRNGGNNFKITK